MKQIESEHQKAFFKWCAIMEKQHPCLKWIHSIPNEGKRSAANGARMKAQGLKSGILDICLPYASNGFYGLYIELKAGKNKLTANQKAFKEYLDANGYKTAVCYSWIEAKEILLEYLNIS
ncbi:VRR-NUC domain-containing protein [Candidatus Pacearchaeota archaeon]|nr:VRR-NUC domain-containing protein [Candidatus Pacearchaeota archaeon]